MFNAIEASNEEVLKEIERVRVMYRLKHTLRYSSQRDMEVHSESVAEHLYAMQVIALYFYPTEDSEGKLNRERVSELMLFHELGEIETGDIVNHVKTDEHRAFEREAAKRVVSQLPESMQSLALERHEEFEAGVTPEARYAHAIDKVEPIFEMWDEKVALPIFRKLGYTKANALDAKYAVAEEYRYMRRFIEAWESRAVALDVFPS